MLFSAQYENSIPPTVPIDSSGILDQNANNIISHLEADFRKMFGQKALAPLVV